MSLELIRKIRHGGRKPTCVHVLIGDVKKGMISETTPMVIVKNSDDLLTIDLRPLIGVDVCVFDTPTADGSRVLSVLNALELSKPRNLFLALKSGFLGANEKHERILHKLWITYQ